MTAFEPAEEIVLVWDAFPVGNLPRPVVFLDAPVRFGDRGFVDGDAKLAWLDGRIAAAIPLPPRVMELILGDRTRAGAGAGAELTISVVEPCEADFWCDRGPRRLAAYRLTVSGLHQPCTVLDPEVECWWPPSSQMLHGWSGRLVATVAKDDLTIRFPAFGGALTEFHRAEFVEYPTCVVGRAVTTERKVASGTAVPAIGLHKQVTGRLEAPLDGRVLVDASGDPIAVLPDASATPPMI